MLTLKRIIQLSLLYSVGSFISWEISENKVCFNIFSIGSYADIWSCASIDTINTKLFIKDHPNIDVQYGFHQCTGYSLTWTQWKTGANAFSKGATLMKPILYINVWVVFYKKLCIYSVDWSTWSYISIWRNLYGSPGYHCFKLADNWIKKNCLHFNSIELAQRKTKFCFYFS
jgi:hypothetical protein